MSISRVVAREVHVQAFTSRAPLVHVHSAAAQRARTNTRTITDAPGAFQQCRSGQSREAISFIKEYSARHLPSPKQGLSRGAHAHTTRNQSWAHSNTASIAFYGTPAPTFQSGSLSCDSVMRLGVPSGRWFSTDTASSTGTSSTGRGREPWCTDPNVLGMLETVFGIDSNNRRNRFERLFPELQTMPSSELVARLQDIPFSSLTDLSHNVDWYRNMFQTPRDELKVINEMLVSPVYENTLALFKGPSKAYCMAYKFCEWLRRAKAALLTVGFADTEIDVILAHTTKAKSSFTLAAETIEQDTHDTLSLLRELEITDEQIRKVIWKEPSVVFRHTDRLRETIQCLGDYGYPSAAIQTAILKVPGIFKIENLEEKMQTLRELYERTGKPWHECVPTFDNDDGFGLLSPRKLGRVLLRNHNAMPEHFEMITEHLDLSYEEVLLSPEWRRKHSKLICRGNPREFQAAMQYMVSLGFHKSELKTLYMHHPGISNVHLKRGLELFNDVLKEDNAEDTLKTMINASPRTILYTKPQAAKIIAMIRQFADERGMTAAKVIRTFPVLLLPNIEANMAALQSRGYTKDESLTIAERARTLAEMADSTLLRKLDILVHESNLEPNIARESIKATPQVLFAPMEALLRRSYCIRATEYSVGDMSLRVLYRYMSDEEFGQEVGMHPQDAPIRVSEM
eukprot:GFYU01019318.1.p1 GENE.GFYU01019318.1~~GFYU01019318.1.p1  ORF type:complete len:683 (-),score=75.29 GFYU01019318.1:235-2283(-)